jgi:hypothetical protein
MYKLMRSSGEPIVRFDGRKFSALSSPERKAKDPSPPTTPCSE